ncbi:type VI secretion system-associated FHA domain protein TagH [uncultured Thiodictyon sp.]|uniref:type VI secretion system-associated FHA domain protein TagH n=1 Tax=uncultured Thiodictyon sp. TaxID=1846217 RepID=UPI0025D476C7|nr:type VI secretion system-associated FHA domain protein TagH [uncultured Thiodictyon sp.]
MTLVYTDAPFVNESGLDMEFSITIARHQGAAPATPTRLTIGESGCIVGRNPGSDLILSDPDRVVSGRHLRLELRDGSPWAIDLGSTNGTFLNQAEERLPVQQPVRLADGDTLNIGPYELVIAAGGTGAARSDPFGLTGDQFLPGLNGPDPTPDIMDLLTPGGAAAGTGPAPPARAFSLSKRSDPFADAVALDPFLGGPAAPAEAGLAMPRPTPFEHVHFRPPEIGPAARPGGAPAGPLVPDDYDLLADDSGDHASDPFADFGAPLPQPPLPVAPLQPVPPPRGGPPADPILSVEPPTPSAVPAAVMSPAPPALAPVVAVPRPARPSQMAPEPVPQPTAPIAVPVTPPVAAPGAAPSALDTGLGSFLAGLGVGCAESIKDPHQFLYDVGELLRELTQGLTGTMQSRAEFKSELRLGVTTIRAAENNPFKFSVGVDEALERLLFRSAPGFLPPVEAARGAFEDIQAHEMAMIAGLRAALRALLARFEPAELERRLGAASGLDKLLPMARRSRYWDLFTETYGQVAADAADDFMQLFGDAFTRAYEDQVHRLAQARRQQGKHG